MDRWAPSEVAVEEPFVSQNGRTAMAIGQAQGVALMAAGIGSLVLVTIFMKIVYVSLPLGEGPFRAVSVTLMGALGIR